MGGLTHVPQSPDHVKRRYGLRSHATTVADIDLRPGGAWRFVQQAPDGEEFAFSGVCGRRALRPAAVVCRWLATRGRPTASGLMGHVSFDRGINS